MSDFFSLLLRRSVMLVVASLAFCQVPILAQESPKADPVSKSSGDSLETKGTSASVVPLSTESLPASAAAGPFLEARQSLFDLLGQAKQLGIGIGAYRLELLEIEAAAAKGESGESLNGRISSLTKNLKDQIQRIRSKDPAQSSESKTGAGQPGWILTYHAELGSGLLGLGSPRVYISKSGIKCGNLTGGSSSLEECWIAKPPAWNLYIFHPHNKTYSATSPQVWMHYHRKKNRYYARGEFIRGPRTDVGGCSAVEFYLSYKPSLKFIVPDTAAQSFLPFQARELASFYTAVPTEIWEIGGDGPALSAAGLKLVKCEKVVIPDSTFDTPTGYRRVRRCWEWCNGGGGQCDQSAVSSLCPEKIRNDELLSKHPRGHRINPSSYPSCDCKW